MTTLNLSLVLNSHNRGNAGATNAIPSDPVGAQDSRPAPVNDSLLLVSNNESLPENDFYNILHSRMYRETCLGRPGAVLDILLNKSPTPLAPQSLLQDLTKPN